MGRIDHQINTNNTYTVRYLTERQPNRNLYTGDRATATTGELRAGLSIRRRARPGIVSSASTALNTLRGSRWKRRTSTAAPNPATFLETNRQGLSSSPMLAHLTFDEQGHSNGQHRVAQAPGLDDSFSWFVPGKGGRPRSEGRLPVPVRPERADEQGSMNGTFTFSTDRAFNAGRSLHLPGTADHSRALAWRPVHAHPLVRVLRRRTNGG